MIFHRHTCHCSGILDYDYSNIWKCRVCHAVYYLLGIIDGELWWRI